MVYACFFIAGAIIFLGCMMYEAQKAIYVIAGVLDEKLGEHDDN